MPNRSRHACDTGFSLVEVLVASALLMVVMLAAASVMAAASDANSTSSVITRATVLAVDKMEQLRALSVDDPALQPSPSGALSANVEGFYDRPDATLLRRWSIEPLPSYPDDAVSIRVAVTQPGSDSGVVLETIKARRTPRAPE